MSKAAPPAGNFTGDVRDTRLVDALSERYLAYALSTIVSRSLPDARDGLKPVHRRLLYAMRMLKLNPDQGFKKCARVVGDVIGKYHPHGDQAVYDTLVRLAQDFAVRYPLIDGQGNFGNIDGDNAAAMRYTESRLTEVAAVLMEGLEENAVDFRPTYDGEDEEPRVFPARFPNLLANGSSGIAVGMATNIPPHNVGEVCDALSHLLKFPNATMEKLVGLIPGPDFPTGGELVETRETIVGIYGAGRGSLRVRARWKVEGLSQGRYRIVVTEIPYLVQKSKLIEKIAELLLARKLPLLADIRDESAEDIRIVLEPKNRVVDADMLMEHLFRQTDMESRFVLNMNVLDQGREPRVMSLRDVLRAFLDHRHEVLIRRTNHRLGKIAARLEILGGMLIAYLNLDEVIRVIREDDEPKKELIKVFDLTDNQAEAILNMRLRQLRKLEEIEIRKENDVLAKEREELENLLKDEDRRRRVIGEDIAEIKKRFGPKTGLGKRRTVLGDAPSDAIVSPDIMIEREPITVVCSDKGWIRAIKGHIETDGGLKFKEGDRLGFAVRGQTTDKLVIFATNGRFYTIGCDKLPGGRGHGEPIRLMIDMPNDVDIVTMFIHVSGKKFVVASNTGRGFIAPGDELIAQTKNGKRVLNVSGDEKAAVCREILPEADHLAVVGENRKLLIFELGDLPEMTRGRGVILQRYKDGGLSDATGLRLAEGLKWRAGTGERTETALELFVGKRATAGRMAMRGFPRSNKFR